MVRRLWAAAVVLVLCGSAGYLAGRSHLLGKLRDGLGLVQVDPPKAQATAPPGGPPEDVARSDTYAELNALLDRRMEEQRREAAGLERLMESHDPQERQLIVEALRAEFLSLLRPWPGPAPNAGPQSTSWFSRDGVDATLVRQETHPGVSLTSVVLAPHGGACPRPGLLVLHGFGGSLTSVVENVDYHHAFGMELARKGFVVLAPLQVTTTVETRSTLHNKALATGWTLRAIDFWQLTRAIDHLASLECVDPNLLGVYGISRGGQNAMQIGALDSRLSLVIASGYFTDRFAWSFRRPQMVPAHHIDIAPDMAFLFDDLNLVALIQPRFFAVESGTQDQRHEDAQREFERVEALYRHLGHPQRAAFLPFLGGHEVSVENVMPFLERWIESERRQAR